MKQPINSIPKRAGTSHDAVYEAVREGIRTGTIEQGTRLKETAVAQELGVSRTTLRQALWRLVAEGFIDFGSRAGFHVRRLDATALHGYVETILLMELAGLDLAIAHADDAALDALCRKYSALSDSHSFTPDPSEYEEFEVELVMLSRNQELWEALTRLQALSHSARETTRSEALRAAHSDLLQALTDRKRRAARKALTHYIKAAFHVDTSVAPASDQLFRPTLQHNDDSVINRIYALIRDKLISFELRPGERLREQDLADEVASSRLSVREVLSRLVAEKIAVWEANKGFSVRSLHTEEIYQLFEMRRILESQMVVLAIERSSATEREEFAAAWETAFENLAMDSSTHIREDEAFHERIAHMARNPILKRELDTVASRIHFVRGIDLREATLDWAHEHNGISRAIAAADSQAAATAIDNHLSRLFEDVRAALKIGVSELYIQ